jgi:thioredoxin 1
LISANDPKFAEKISFLQKEKPIYVYCLSGGRSKSVANYLCKNGFTKVYNLKGGLLAWQQDGYSITQSEHPITSNSKTYTLSEFNKLIISKVIVLIDFQAIWCAPCKKMAPVIDEVQKDYGEQAAFEKIDIEVNKLLQTTYNVESIPGLILFKNGKEVWRYTGFINSVDLSKVIKQNL